MLNLKMKKHGSGQHHENNSVIPHSPQATNTKKTETTKAETILNLVIPLKMYF